jgi:hypothetical protein
LTTLESLFEGQYLMQQDMQFSVCEGSLLGFRK